MTQVKIRKAKFGTYIVESFKPGLAPATIAIVSSFEKAVAKQEEYIKSNTK